MRLAKIQSMVLVAVACVASTANAAVVYNSLPGNYMVTQPIYAAYNNGQNVVGTNSNFPENPQYADGDIISTPGGFSTVGRMQELSLTAAQGFDGNGNAMVGTYYQPNDTVNGSGHFIQGTYGAINYIRIWTGTGSYQFNPASEVSVYYSTQTHTENSGGGWWGNPPGINSGSAAGTGDYTNVATILGVSGGPVVSAFDPNNPDAIALTNSNYTLDSADQRQYVDLMVNIPAGATSLLFGFGINDTFGQATGITDIQASAVPEPATISLMGLASLGLLSRRRR
jgi:hypothetical protein